MADDQPTLLLRDWRKYRGLTQEQLAEGMETTKAVISDIERGYRRWNATHLSRAAEFLNCRPSDLLSTKPGEETASVLEIWSRVPAHLKPLALKTLENFAEEHLKSK